MRKKTPTRKTTRRGRGAATGAAHAAREDTRTRAALAALTGLTAGSQLSIADAVRLAWDYADTFIEEGERRTRPTVSGIVSDDDGGQEPGT